MNSPTQGQPTARKKWLKVAFGPLFFVGGGAYSHLLLALSHFTIDHASLSRRSTVFVGGDLFYIGNRPQETQPNQILRRQPLRLFTNNTEISGGPTKSSHLSLSYVRTEFGSLYGESEHAVLVVRGVSRSLPQRHVVHVWRRHFLVSPRPVFLTRNNKENRGMGRLRGVRRNWNENEAQSAPRPSQDAA